MPTGVGDERVESSCRRDVGIACGVEEPGATGGPGALGDVSPNRQGDWILGANGVCGVLAGVLRSGGGRGNGSLGVVLGLKSSVCSCVMRAIAAARDGRSGVAKL